MKAINDIKDNIVWYVYDKPKDIYRTIKHWLYCNCNVQHWRLVKKSFTSYGWDYCFGLQLEELMIDKQLHWFEHHQLMVDEQYEQILRSLRWTKYCIHILNNDHDLYHYDGELKSIDTGDGKTKRIDTSDLIYVYDGPKLNWRNCSRFCETNHIKFFKEFQHEYYLRKVKNLYYELRKNYTEYWWD